MTSPHLFLPLSIWRKANKKGFYNGCIRGAVRILYSGPALRKIYG